MSVNYTPQKEEVKYLLKLLRAREKFLPQLEKIRELQKQGLSISRIARLALEKKI